MNNKQFRTEVKEPFYSLYKEAVEEKGYFLGLGRGHNAPDGSESLEARLQPGIGKPDFITPEKLTEIKKILHHGEEFYGFYVNVSYVGSVYAQKE